MRNAHQTFHLSEFKLCLWEMKVNPSSIQTIEETMNLSWNNVIGKFRKYKLVILSEMQEKWMNLESSLPENGNTCFTGDICSDIFSRARIVELRLLKLIIFNCQTIDCSCQLLESPLFSREKNGVASPRHTFPFFASSSFTAYVPSLVPLLSDYVPQALLSLKSFILWTQRTEAPAHCQLSRTLNNIRHWLWLTKWEQQALLFRWRYFWCLTAQSARIRKCRCTHMLAYARIREVCDFHPINFIGILSNPILKQIWRDIPKKKPNGRGYRTKKPIGNPQNKNYPNGICLWQYLSSHIYACSRLSLNIRKIYVLCVCIYDYL